MSVPINYVTVIFIWATTPLAVQWSNDSVSPIAAVTARMALAFAFALLLAAVIQQLRLDFAEHWKLYAAASIGLFPNMPLVYWAAEYISSGLISVIFGLSPFVVALANMKFLPGEKLSVRQWVALFLALAGLLVIFYQQLSLGPNAVFGVVLMLLSVLLFSLSSVLVKHFHSGANPLQQLNGSLLIALPGFVVCWVVFDGVVPVALSSKTIYSVTYLAVVGSLLGFMAYFYLLKNIEVSRVALIPLITPALAVMLGVAINSENLSSNMVAGTALIVLGLALFQNQSLQGGKLLWAKISNLFSSSHLHIRKIKSR